MGETTILTKTAISGSPASLPSPVGGEHRGAPRRSTRRTMRAVAIGLSLTLSPVFIAGASHASRPTVVVTGLSTGTRGESVKTLQQALIGAGVEVRGGADGVFGPATAAAVSSFQKRQGLAQTGSVDDTTAIALGLLDGPLVGLRRGSNGGSVRVLQQALVDAGINVAGGVDGIYGSGTEAAVKKYQQSRGLSTSGTVDKATAGALAAKQGASNNSSGSPSEGGSSTSTSDTASSNGSMLGLGLGSKGSAVSELQQRLGGVGYTVGADGVFGRATANALSSFQYSNGLKATASVDERTLKVLLLLKAPSSAAKPSAGVTKPTSALAGLRAGALGAAVKELQNALLKAGVTVRGGADGIFGPATAAAVKSFQTSQGIEATGRVDDATVTALANPKKAPTNTNAGSGGTGGYAIYGERGSRVLAVQSALIKAGISIRGGADGIFGAATAGGIVSFQRSNGLSATGQINDATAKALGITGASAPSAPAVANVTLQAFPVQGRCYYSDTWHYSR